MEIVYIDKNNYEDNIKIVNAIEIATNYEWKGKRAITTLMGYNQIFDEEGREVTCDPNFIDSSVNICGKEYNITKKGWNVYIWKPNINGNYCKLMTFFDMKKDGSNYEDFFFAVIDLTPDYVREYWDKHKE